MLGTKYGVYHNADTNSYIVRTQAYSLPSVLRSHVSVVAPTTYFGNTRGMRSTSHVQEPESESTDGTTGMSKAALAGPGLAAVPASCNSQITPACLRALYNTTSYVPKATATNKIGIAGYLDEFANNADLQVRIPV